MPAPSLPDRAVASLTLRFGDLHIPVHVLRRSQTVHLQVTPAHRANDGTLTPVTLCYVDPDSRCVAPPERVVPVVEVDGEHRILTEADMRAALCMGAVTPILHYVRDVAAYSEYDVVNTYVLAADTTGARGGQRALARRTALALLLEALAEQQAVAVIVTTFEGTPRFAMIDADGTLSTLNYAHEFAELPTGPVASLDPADRRHAAMIVARDLTHVAMPLVDTNSTALRAWLAAPSEPERHLVEEPVAVPNSPAQIIASLAATVAPVRQPRPRRPRVHAGNATTAATFTVTASTPPVPHTRVNWGDVFASTSSLAWGNHNTVTYTTLGNDALTYVTTTGTRV